MAARSDLPAPAEVPPIGSDVLRLIFDHAIEGISVFDADLRLQAWNARFLGCTGLDAALVHRGAPLRELLVAMAQAGEFGAAGRSDPEADADRRIEELRRGVPAVVERVRPNGRTIELRRNPTPGGGFVMLYADITARHTAATALADQ